MGLVQLWVHRRIGTFTQVQNMPENLLELVLRSRHITLWHSHVSKLLPQTPTHSKALLKHLQFVYVVVLCPGSLTQLQTEQDSQELEG